MTVINKLEAALSSTKGLASSFKTFSLDTDDQEAKQMFDKLATNAENMAQTLESRVNYLRTEEPQYNQQQ